ncbi:MAG: squalene/phytoene synthase family protein [Rhodospirillaceae bacterium]|jgi:phytoene/squalene synthetase|nr:squalene/phytoene synthase family protein [Rhodospirillaceae bacterium]
MSPAEAHSRIAQDVRSAKSSFYWPMLFQAKAKREGLFAIYALARILDDIADGSTTQRQKHNELYGWRTWISSCFRNEAAPQTDNPLKIGLYDVIKKYSLPLDPFNALITGMEADVNGPIIAPTSLELEEYCGQVAGAVGELCLIIWGWQGKGAQAFAAATGEALQLTNILRDVREDAVLGRVYLPKEALIKADITARQPLDIVNDPNLSMACDLVIRRAKKRFRDAEALWPNNARRDLQPALVMLKLYKALFEKVQTAGFSASAPRVRLSGLEKILRFTASYLNAS